MPKRDPEIEATDEELIEAEVPTVGHQLRAAREKKKLSLDDIAAQTRIPRRHLESIENAEWDELPAPTYTIGFAKSYAGSVGLDRAEIGDQLRAEMGGQRFTANTMESFEPADPRRTMPKSLVLGTIAAVIILIALMSWLNQRSLQQADEPTNATAEQTAVPANPQPQPAASATAQGAVVLTATAPVWLQVSEKGGASLFSGMLQPGQTYAVPATATAPVLKTGKPEALKITVGNAVAPPVGSPATTVTDVSLLAASLMNQPSSAPAANTPAPQAAAPSPKPQPARRRRAAAPAPAPAAPPPAAEAAPATSNTGE